MQGMCLAPFFFPLRNQSDLFSAAAASSSQLALRSTIETTSEHGLSQNGGEFSATHFWVKMKLKATMAKLFWGHIGTLFFSPLIPFKESKGYKECA